MTRFRVAIGVPHTPWIQERAKHIESIRDELVPHENNNDIFYREFYEREPNWSWAARMYDWAISTRCSHFLTVQDDMFLVPDFLEYVERMLHHVPDKVIGLHSVHPLAGAILKDGRRWFRTRCWLVGGAWLCPMSVLRDHREWCKANQERVKRSNEDSLLNEWLTENGIDVWHPTPTIVSHLTHFKSTYANDTHANRKTEAAWTSGQEMPISWRPESDVPILLMPHQIKDIEKRKPQVRTILRTQPVKVNGFELTIPEAEVQSVVDVFQKDLYACPELPDVSLVRYVLDTSIGCGAFAHYAHLRWPGSWIVGREPNKDLRQIAKLNVPEGSRILDEADFMLALEHGNIGQCDVVRICDEAMLDALLSVWEHMKSVKILYVEVPNNPIGGYESILAGSSPQLGGFKLLRSHWPRPDRGVSVYARTKGVPDVSGMWRVPA